MANNRLKSPHLLLASPNPKKLLENIRHLISKKSQRAIETEIHKQVQELYDLGIEHFTFAIELSPTQWRQKISRLYYAAYNCSRAVRLEHGGSFSTESSDHVAVGDLPDTLPNHATYRIRLKVLREDRNLADYSHDSSDADLVIPAAEAERLVSDFLTDAKNHLKARGLIV